MIYIYIYSAGSVCVWFRNRYNNIWNTPREATLHEFIRKQCGTSRVKNFSRRERL